MYVVKWKSDRFGSTYQHECPTLTSALEWAEGHLAEISYEVYKTDDPPNKRPFLSRLFGG